MTSLRVVLGVLRDPQLRRVQLGLLAFAACEHATWLAVTVFAYRRGGVGEAGVVVFVQLGSAAAIVPFVSFIADRFPRDRVLAAGFGAQAVAFGACGLAMTTGANVGVIYALATIAAICVTFSRPTVAAVVPALVTTPAELTAANVAGSFAQGLGMFLGPAGGGLLLTRLDSGAIFVASMALMALVSVSTSRIELKPVWVEVESGEASESWSAELMAGLSLLRGEANSRMLVGLLMLSSTVIGALDVAFVAVAIELLDRTEATAGLFAAAFGIGGVLGAAGSVTLVKRRRLTFSLAIGVLIAGLPVALLAGDANVALSATLLVLAGVGFAAADISGRTMLQGLTPDDTLARVFGVLEGLSMAGLALGGLWFSRLVAWLGLRPALVVVGLTLPGFVALRLRRLTAIDASRPDVDPSLLGFVRRLPVFAPLPVYAIEQLLVNFVPERYEPGETVFDKGDPGDRFYLVSDGSADVEFKPAMWKHCETGDFFGEIALLRDVPRTATVRGGANGMTVQVLERDVFLAAVTGSRRSLTRLESIVAERLDESL